MTTILTLSALASLVGKLHANPSPSAQERAAQVKRMLGGLEIRMTPGEMIVTTLCKKAFLSVWTMSNPMGKRTWKGTV